MHVVYETVPLVKMKFHLNVLVRLFSISKKFYKNEKFTNTFKHIDWIEHNTNETSSSSVATSCTIFIYFLSMVLLWNRCLSVNFCGVIKISDYWFLLSIREYDASESKYASLFQIQVWSGSKQNYHKIPDLAIQLIYFSLIFLSLYLSFFNHSFPHFFLHPIITWWT
jgi:hypothetical protein